MLLTRRECAAFLRKDADGFVASLSPVDLVARGGHRDAAGYVAAAVADLPEAPPGQAAARIVEAAIAADAEIARLRPGIGGLLADDLKRIAAMPWRVALTTAAYEGGLPHTRSDVVFMPVVSLGWDHARLVGTLAHEKIHVYQRAFPEEARAAAARLGCFPACAARPALARSNPDVAGTYVDPSGVIMRAVYASSAPRGLGDVVLSSPLGEHPYETTAYAVGDHVRMNIERTGPRRRSDATR